MADHNAESLGEALPREVARVRELLGGYESIGKAGIFGAMELKAALDRASVAMVSGDLVAMIASYHELSGCE